MAREQPPATAGGSDMDELIKVAEDNGIVTVTLNRPERLNALVGHMRRDLAEAAFRRPIDAIAA